MGEHRPPVQLELANWNLWAVQRAFETFSCCLYHFFRHTRPVAPLPTDYLHQPPFANCEWYYSGLFGFTRCFYHFCRHYTAPKVIDIEREYSARYCSTDGRMGKHCSYCCCCSWVHSEHCTFCGPDAEVCPLFAYFYCLALKLFEQDLQNAIH